MLRIVARAPKKFVENSLSSLAIFAGMMAVGVGVSVVVVVVGRIGVHDGNRPRLGDDRHDRANPARQQRPGLGLALGIQGGRHVVADVRGGDRSEYRGERRLLAREQRSHPALLETGGLPVQTRRFANTRILNKAHPGAAPLWVFSGGLWLLMLWALLGAVVVLAVGGLLAGNPIWSDWSGFLGPLWPDWSDLSGR